MREDILKALRAFGLSMNQAKVYLSIIQTSRANINTISKDTMIHKQDIYTIVPKLEKMGLISKTIERPISIKALPPEKAFNYIIAAEKERVRCLQKNLKRLTETIENLEGTREELEGFEIPAIFYTADNPIIARLDKAYANAKEQCCLAINFDLMCRRIPHLERRFQALAANRVKTKILIDRVERIGDVRKILKQLIPPNGDFTAKLPEKVTIKPYLIIDNKEALISTHKLTPEGFPCMLWTNVPNIIAVYRDNFNKAWANSPSIHEPPTDWAEKTLETMPNIKAN